MQDHMPRALLGTFTKGAIRLTQSGADAFDPHKVSFADILQADQLSKCLLTSYVVEEDWLREQLVNVPRIILVTDGGRRSSQVEKYTLPGSRLTMVHPRFPPFPNYGVMHIKLMLLWYEEAGFLRVVVSSGNLRSEDYDRLQNILYVQDLPRRRLSSQGGQSNEFLLDLLRLLPSMGITEDLVSEEGDLRAYDWSALRVRLVCSLPGMHSVVGEAPGTGLAMLARKVSGPSPHQLLLECQGSSLGSLEASWLADVQCCARGLSPSPPGRRTDNMPESAFTKSAVPKRVRLQGSPEGRSSATTGANAESNVRIVFPTLEYVMGSDPGIFGTIFCRSDMWQRDNYPRDLFHRCESRYGRGQPLHSKIITAFATDQDEQGSSVQAVRWWYVGSHNFTPSAWGKFVKEKRSILIANYELGVVIPATAAIAETLFPPSPSGDTEVGQRAFPYPYLRPPPSYTLDDAPWMQDLFYGD